MFNDTTWLAENCAAVKSVGVVSIAVQLTRYKMLRLSLYFVDQTYKNNYTQILSSRKLGGGATEIVGLDNDAPTKMQG